ncbi:LPXTG cell wall anchor domain-containing protein [Actinomyces sp. S4-C9]
MRKTPELPRTGVENVGVAVIGAVLLMTAGVSTLLISRKRMKK